VVWGHAASGAVPSHSYGSEHVAEVGVCPKRQLSSYHLDVVLHCCVAARELAGGGGAATAKCSPSCSLCVAWVHLQLMLVPTRCLVPGSCPCPRACCPHLLTSKYGQHPRLGGMLMAAPPASREGSWRLATTVLPGAWIHTTPPLAGALADSATNVGHVTTCARAGYPNQVHEAPYPATICLMAAAWAGWHAGSRRRSC
jgi:hypothetical protein